MSKGFCNWTVCFKKHEQSSCHKEAVEMMISIPASTRDVGEMLSSQLAIEKKKNREIFLTILACIQFLGRQGLALRGDGDEVDGNFMQLLKLQAGENPTIKEWLSRKTMKHTSHQIQDEILKIMAQHVLRSIAANLQESPFISIMADETTDISNHEQVVIVIRWITKDLIVHEEFIGLYEVACTDSATITAAIMDVLTRLNLSLSKVCGQCYDGASSMSGSQSGVAKRITDLEPRALFTHCYGHSLNLAASDSIKQSELMQEALDTTREITKLVKCSPKCEAIFKNIKESISTKDNSPGIRILCPTRWTVRADSLASITKNYTDLVHTWETAKRATSDSEAKARIQGVSSQMQSFRYLFGNMLAEKVLRHTDNLSRTLQHMSMSAAAGQEIARMTVATLQSIRNDESYELFWEEVTSTAEQVDVDEPLLPRRRRRPKRFDDGMSEGAHHDTPKDLYRQEYFQAFDAAIACINSRFDQPGYKIYNHLEQLLLKAARQEDYMPEFEAVCEFYNDDLQPELLKAQLATFALSFIQDHEDIDQARLTVIDIQKHF